MIAPNPTFVVTLPDAQPLDTLWRLATGVFAGGSAGAVWRVDPATGDVVWHAPNGGGGRIAPLPDGDTALYFSSDGLVSLLEPRRGRRTSVGRLSGHTSVVERVTPSPCGRRVFVQAMQVETGDDECYGVFEEVFDTGLMWDVDLARVVWHEREVRYPVPVVFSPDGRRLWLPPGEERPAGWKEAKSGRVQVRYPCERWLRQMRVTGAGDRALHLSDDLDALAESDLAAGPHPPARHIKPFTSTERLLALADEERAVVTVDGLTIALWSREDGSWLGATQTLPRGFEVASAVVLPEGAALLVGSGDGRLARFELGWERSPTALAPALGGMVARTGLEPTL